MFVQETNSPEFQQLSQEMKQKRALHKRKEWEEEHAKLATEGKQNPAIEPGDETKESIS
jgi:hypothetical protein